MQSLKAQFDKLDGFYDPRYAGLQMQLVALNEKVSKHIQRLAANQGCIADSSYIRLVQSALYSGLFSFSAFKKNHYSKEEILAKY